MDQEMYHLPENARWICADKECVSPVFCRRFSCTGIRSATLVITGLGYFEAHLNGMRAGDDRFVPVASDYEPRKFRVITYPCRDTFTHRIYYYTYDVTAAVQQGDNLLTVQLGNGFYRQTERTAEGDLSYSDTLKTIFALFLCTEDGEQVIVSDETALWRESPIRFSNLFLGETIDATFADRAEHPASLCPAPASVLSPAIGVPDRLIRTVTPTLCGVVDGKRIYDCGETVSGVVRLQTAAPKGTKITLRFSETRGQNGELTFVSTGSNYICKSGVPQIMEDTFIANGEPYTFEPKFVWHAFRFFSVEGVDEADVTDLTVCVIHSDTPVTSTFQSDCEGFNFLFDSFIATQLAASHGSFPSDCPHRERLGYTGDGQNCCEAAMLMLDSREFYRKWIRDILDCQDPKTGHVQHTAPFMGGAGGPGGWGCAIVIVPYQYYRRFGDVNMLKTCYEPMKAWMGYLHARCPEGLVGKEEPDVWCLGDWSSPEQMTLPAPFVNTYFYIRCLRIMQKIARVIGHEADIPAFAAEEKRSYEAVRQNFRDPATGHYCEGRQGADAYAASLGLDLPETARFTAEFYRELGRFDTGFLGTDVLLDVLFENGYADVVYQLLQSEDFGSFLSMKRQGATTLWEYWDGNGVNSHCHPMFGGCSRHLLTHLLGIGQGADDVGYRKPVIRPRIPSQMTFAAGSVRLENGTLSVAWERQTDKITFTVTLPDGADGTLVWAGHEYPLVGGTQTVTVS